MQNKQQLFRTQIRNKNVSVGEFQTRDGSHENNPRPSDLLLDIPLLLLHYLSHSSHRSLEMTLINVKQISSGESRGLG